jgi:hypothetical protein
MNRTQAMLTALAAAATLRCSDGGTAPPSSDTPGTAVLSLGTAHADDGAVVLTLRGTGVSSIQAVSSAHVVVSRPAGPDETRVIVVGDLVAGPLLRVHVPAVNRLSAYSASIDQAATRDDVLRESVAGYTLTFGP